MIRNVMKIFGIFAFLLMAVAAGFKP
jgi:hypothetical protein